MFARARRGEGGEAVALIGQLVDAEPPSLAAFERYEALGLLPPVCSTAPAPTQVTLCHKRGKSAPDL